MQVLTWVGLIVVPVVLLGLGLELGDRYAERDRAELSVLQRALVWLSASGLGLGAGLSRMARLLPRSWSDHPESRYPQHRDRWPPR